MPHMRPTQPVHQKCYSHSLWHRTVQMPQWQLLHPLFPLHRCIFPPCRRCVAPISTAALSQSKSEPHRNVTKAPRHFSLHSSDWAARPVVPCATPGDSSVQALACHPHPRHRKLTSLWDPVGTMRPGIFIPVCFCSSMLAEVNSFCLW